MPPRTQELDSLAEAIFNWRKTRNPNIPAELIFSALPKESQRSLVIAAAAAIREYEQQGRVA